MKPDDVAASELIEAGLRIMVDQPAKLLDRGLRSEDVYEQANISHATFYRKFATKERFIAEVLATVADFKPTNPIDVGAAVREELKLNRNDVRRAVRSLVANNFNTFDGDAVTRRLLALTFGGSSPRTLRAIKSSYERSDTVAISVCDHLLGPMGITFRKPFTVKTVGVVLTALIEGFAVRRHLDPEAVSADLLADVLLAMASAMLSTNQDHGHIYDTLAAFAPPADEAGALPRDPRMSIITAARDEFARHGYFAAALDTIAAESEIPAQTVRQLFPTKLHIVVGALKSRYHQLDLAIQDDVLIGKKQNVVLENHFSRCAHLVADETVFMDALMAAVAHDTYSEPDGMLAVKQELHFPALIEPIIQQGQDAGLFDTGEPASELAALLTNTLLLRCFTRRSVEPEANARFVASIVLNGLHVR